LIGTAISEAGGLPLFVFLADGVTPWWEDVRAAPGAPLVWRMFNLKAAFALVLGMVLAAVVVAGGVADKLKPPPSFGRANAGTGGPGRNSSSLKIVRNRSFCRRRAKAEDFSLSIYISRGVKSFSAERGTPAVCALPLPEH
jgi:hypothetical protein